MSEKVWVARCSDKLGQLFNFDLSPTFATVYDCQAYIDKNLKHIEEHLKSAFVEICLIKHMIFVGGNFIRCYHIKQKRFADGFDF